MNKEAARKTRSVIMFIGPLMHAAREFIIPYAGGCELGQRRHACFRQTAGSDLARR